MSNTLYLIVGASGSGKDSIVNELCDKQGYKRVVSYTTRPCRNEEDKKSHIFVSEEDYRKDKTAGQVVADVEFDGNYYWATKKQIEDSDFYIIDPKGIRTLYNNYYYITPEKYRKDLVTIQITASWWRRIWRMYRREADKAENFADHMKYLWKAVKRWWHDTDKFNIKADYVIENNGCDIFTPRIEINRICVNRKINYEYNI